MCADDQIILMNDERVKLMPAFDCGEALVDLSIDQDFICDLSDENMHEKSTALFVVRSTVRDILKQAQKYLPNDVKFLLKECYRPLSLQEFFFARYTKRLETEHPDWSAKKIYDECSKLIAPPDIAPHSTGGALDLILIDPDGNPMEMGTDFDARPLDTEYATYTHAKNICEAARINRETLVSAMSGAGFVNYPTEWWHWSYGDKYWAVQKGRPSSIYMPKNLEEKAEVFAV
jgi:D-alanyl-D-alanine dipeptidase